MASITELPAVKKEETAKSSTEILSELFMAFNAKPPSLSDDDMISKKPKAKKKSKHKKKKKKKRSRSASSAASDSDSESGIPGKKSKKSKRKKRKQRKKHKHDDKDASSDASVPLREDDPSASAGSSFPRTEEIPVPETPDVSRIRLPEEDHSAKDNSADTTKNKIRIKNLKYSSVYEATVKQAEEEARKRAEKYEDGELIDSAGGSGSDSARPASDADSVIDERICGSERKAIGEEKTTEKLKDDDKKLKENSKKCEKSSRETGSKSRGESREKSSKRSGSRSRKRSRSGSSSKRERDAKRHRSRSRRRSESRHDYESGHRRRDRRRSKERENRIEIDKKRLLEIARKNAITMLQTGTLPTSANMGVQAQQKVITAIKCGGKSVDELTDFCKNLSRQEAVGELSSVSSGSNSEAEAADSVTKPFNNPFQLKDRTPIVMNIKGGTNLPTQSFQEKTLEQTKVLRQQFPVSSGSQHRGAENEWRPVSPPTQTSSFNIPKTSHNAESSNGTTKSSSVTNSNNSIHATTSSSNQGLSTMPGMIQAPNIPTIPPGPQVFPTDLDLPTMDIGSIVSQRLSAIRRLQQNPNDINAMEQIAQANQEMSRWVQSKQEPGQFTGSTGAQILTPKELASGYQAWAKRDQLQTAAPVSSGMGMHLLQKMGWKPGEGLGKQKNGTLTPLLLEVKLDTRGLVAKEEARQKNNAKKLYVPTVKTLAGKHPVSLLGEYCSKRKLGVPTYTLCFECGPNHKKNFLFKVTVNGIEYQPSVASANKKRAKADAATVCLQKLGIIP